MMLTDLKTKSKVVGTKETLKAIENNIVIKVYLANDIDRYLKNSIINVLNDNNIPIEYVESKFKLGRACGIDVAAASAAILK